MNRIILALTLLLVCIAGKAQFVVNDTENHAHNVDASIVQIDITKGTPTFGGIDIANIKTITRSFPYFNLSRQHDAIYGYGSKSDSRDGSANYYLALSDVEIEYTEDGQMVPKSNGATMFLDLFAPNCEDPNVAILPSGIYTINDARTSMTCSNTYTFARVRNERTGEDFEYKVAESGTVEVMQIGTDDEGYGIYRIYVEYLTAEVADAHIGAGERIRAMYEGKLEFRNLGGGTDGGDDRLDKEMNTPVETTFKGMSITCHGGDSDYYRYTLQLFDGTDRPDGLLTDGVVLNIDLFGAEPKGDNKLVLEPGTYVASLPYEQVDEFKPGYFLPGACYSIMGMPLVIGTYAQDMRDIAEGQDMRYGYILTGTVTIEREGGQYSLTCDLMTDLGISIKGTLPMSDVRIIDRRPVEPLGPWESYLTDDHEIVYSNDTYAYAHCYANYPVASVNEFEIIVNDHITNESFQLDILVPAGQKSPAGHYTAGAEGEYKANTFIPGYRNFAVLGGTWAWQYFENNSGEPTQVAPGVGGEIDIKDNGDGTFTIEFSLLDDAEPQHTVRTRWSGVINDPWHSWTK